MAVGDREKPTVRTPMDNLRQRGQHVLGHPNLWVLLLLLCVRCKSHLDYKGQDEECCPIEFLPAYVQLFLQSGVLRPRDVPFSLD